MSEINKYLIAIETKETSDPEKAESIKKRIEDPTEVRKNFGVLHKDILSMGAGSRTAADEKFIGQAFKALNSVITTIVQTLKGIQQPTAKKPKQQEAKEETKATKEVTSGLRKTSKELEKTAISLEKTTKELQKSKKEQPKKTTGTVPWAGEEQPPIPVPKSKIKQKKSKRRWDLVAPSAPATEVEARATEQEKKRAAEQEKKRAAEKPKIPHRRPTGKEASLIDSSDALMSQIKNDFRKFKKNLADTIRTRLQTEHASGFQVVEGKKGAYTRRGGTEILKIADMAKLTNALVKLTNATDKEITALAEKGPEAMIERASTVSMENLVSGFGKTGKTRMSGSLKQITEYLNKHGYEGTNAAVQKLITRQTTKEKKLPVSERQGVTTRQLKQALGGAKATQQDINKVLAETSGKEYIGRNIGEAIQEVVVPRPVAGPQGLPAVQLQTGRHRALAPEYEFTPGILAASEFAGKLIKTGGKDLPGKDITDRIKGTITDKYVDERGKVTTKVPNIKQMMVAGDVGGMAAHASDIMEVMKTDKKGRLELINAYRTVLGAKGKKVIEVIPKGKTE